jgi:hypothetical protein
VTWVLFTNKSATVLVRFESSRYSLATSSLELLVLGLEFTPKLEPVAFGLPPAIMLAFSCWFKMSFFWGYMHRIKHRGYMHRHRIKQLVFDHPEYQWLGRLLLITEEQKLSGGGNLGVV